MLNRASADVDALVSPVRRGSITWRSVGLGTLAVAFVAGLAPFNDYVVANTYLIGSYLPIALVIVVLPLILLNGIVSHRAPGRALSGGELAVVVAMLLAGSAVPTTGLMRIFLPFLVAPFHFANQNESFWRLLQEMELPAWLFPTVDRRSSVVSDFYGRVPPGSPIPWGAWVVPLCVWGVFFASMYATFLGLSMLLLRQWAVNERLPFPLAQVNVALIEPPAPGRRLNALLRSWAFWGASGAVIFVHSVGMLSKMHPQYVPEIPLRYDLRGVMSNEPWVHLGWFIKQATIYFTFIGIAYFVQARVSFSLWFFLVLGQVINVQVRSYGSEIHPAAWEDQHLGAAFVYLLGVIYVGRLQWGRILTLMVTRAQPHAGWSVSEQRSARWAAWSAMLGLVGMAAFLLFIGVSSAVTAGIIVFILVTHVVTARIVAETGLSFIRTNAILPHLYQDLPTTTMTSRDVFFAGMLSPVTVNSARESLLTFALHGQRVHDAFDPPPRQRARLVWLLAWAVLLSYVVASASSIACYYTYAAPLSTQAPPVLNPAPLQHFPQAHIVDPVVRHASGQWAPTTHNPWVHIGLGAAITAGLQYMAIRSASWPLMPVGYLVHSYWYMHMAWFSLMLGWAAKVLILRFGGASLFMAARPLFIGLIFGEAMAAGLWLVINLLLAQGGYEYHPTTFLPM